MSKRKPILVVEIGDDGHVGQVVARKGSKRLVRWNPKRANWLSRTALRPANPQEREAWETRKGI